MEFSRCSIRKTCNVKRSMQRFFNSGRILRGKGFRCNKTRNIFREEQQWRTLKLTAWHGNSDQITWTIKCNLHRRWIGIWSQGANLHWSCESSHNGVRQQSFETISCAGRWWNLATLWSRSTKTFCFEAWIANYSRRPHSMLFIIETKHSHATAASSSNRIRNGLIPWLNYP